VPTDTRGILDPAELARHAVLHRYPAGDVLDGLVEWFWAVHWHLPDGAAHVQKVLNHPSGHISIGTTDDTGATVERPGARVYGLITRVSERRLVGSGWTVAAKTSTGGLGALIGRPARSVTDRALSFDDAFGLDGATLVAEITGLGDESRRIDRLRTALESVAAQRDPARLDVAREVAAVARIAETDRSVLRVEQLAAAAGVGVRTLQRMFGEYVGASPAWVIRRWRIIEAAERAGGPQSWAGWPGWADLAAELGYSDQAHLVRDVRRHLGVPPGRYRSRQRPAGTDVVRSGRGP
jgi:AraC-like DNA-binding protein